MTSWDAAVVVLLRDDGKVLGVTRGDNLYDINLPGGLSEPSDRTMLDTARREFREETGLTAGRLNPIASWHHNGKRIVAFQALSWSGQLRQSEEGYPVWVSPDRLMRPGCTYREVNRRLVRHPALL